MRHVRTAWPFWLLTASLVVLLLSANLPTPLYQGYRERFGFNSLVLTLIFATYAVVLVPSLVLFGQLSDGIGRRPVIAIGLTVATAAMVAFGVAGQVSDGTAWLFVARGLQGLAVGMVTGTAAAGLVEYEPTGDRSRAALFATLGQTGGGALGPLVAGALAQWAPWRWLLPCVVGAALTAGVAVAVGRMPERMPPRGRWRPQWPSIPRAGRTIFVRAGVTAGTAWAAGALFLSVVPTYASVVLNTHNLAILGAIAAVTLASASVAQAVSLRIGVSPDAGQGVGLLFLVGGLGALVGASPTRSAVLLVAGALLAGAGLGLSYVGAQAQVNQVAPADRRGEVTAAFVTCVYIGLSTGAIGVGLLTDALSLFAALAIMSAVIGAVAIATALWHLRSDQPGDVGRR